MNNKICCIFNYGSHYRKSIFQLMDRELKCDFFLGDNLPGDIMKMDYCSLNGYKGSIRNIWFFKKFYWQTKSLYLIFKPYKYYVIDGEPYCVSNWAILLIARILGKKSFCWTHGWYGRESTIKKLSKKIFFEMSHHIFVYGDYAKELMIQHGFAPGKLSCIYNSLNYEEQLALRVTLNASGLYKNHFNNGYANLIFCGRLTFSKRLDILLKALSILKNEHYYFNLTFLGEGECTEQLHSLVKHLGLVDNIWFYGACYEEKVIADFIYNADLCVSPGNVGLTAIHSLTYGTPVITHDNFPYQMPEFEAIIEGSTGSFFNYENEGSLAERIKYWFYYAKSRERIREACYQVIDSKYNPTYQIDVLKSKLILD